MSDLLAMGEGMGIIVGVIDKDKDGNPLKMNNGGTYRKIKLTVVDELGARGYIYDPIFGGDKSKIKAMVESNGNASLIDKFNKGTLQDSDLFGKRVRCVIGIKYPKEGTGYDPQNIIDCYMPYEPPTATQMLLNGATPEYVPQQRPVGGMSDAELNDDVPF